MITRFIFENITDADLTHIFECGQCFRWVPCRDGYLGAAGDKAAFVRLSDGTLTIFATGGDEAFWGDYFDLDTDYGRIKDSLVSGDPGIKAATDYGFGIRILNQDPFETVISFIISQNNNIPRIRKNIESICEKYGKPIAGSEELLAQIKFDEPDSEELLKQIRFNEAGSIEARAQSKAAEIAGEGPALQCKDTEVRSAELTSKTVNAEKAPMYAFPEPQALAAAETEDLAALRLGYRSAYIKAAAQRYLECGCPACREELLEFLGVGPKVANCIMLFGLRDTAAFPVDTWVRHIMNDMYGFDEKDAKGMQAFAADRFGNLAGYAQQYLFYYYRDRR